MSFNDYQIPPPSDWQKFERLCRDIWALEWNDKNTSLNGRQGQPQSGVDVYGCLNGDVSKTHGVQCKGKNQFNHIGLTENELISEVEKALKFKPQLADFIIATTAPNDTKIQEVARKLSETNPFRVTIYSWDSIVSLLGKYEFLANNYLTDIGIKSSINKNKIFFEDWYNTYINIDNTEDLGFWYNTSYLPNAFFDVGFQYEFINRLVGYCQSIDSFKHGIRENEIDSELFLLFNQFSEVVGDISFYIRNNLDSYKAHRPNRSFATFWVKSNEDYLCGNFIEYKKGILKSLFYTLVTATNTIISYYNKNYNVCYKLRSFAEDEAQSEKVFPGYIDDQKYIGLNNIAKFVYDQYSREFQFKEEC